jgi:flagellar motor switch/type III secretory pathway protein FliN
VNASTTIWQRGRTGLPLRAWRDAQHAALADALSCAMRDWERAWSLPAASDRIRCVAATADAQEQGWRPLAAKATAKAWFRRGTLADALLARALWDIELATTPIACAVQASCAQDLLARLAAALRLEADRDGAEGPPGGCWSGALGAELPWDLRVLVNVQAVEALVGTASPTARAQTRAPLVALHRAISHRPVALSVHLTDCEIALGSLRDLQVGDVLRLEHALDAPLQVRDTEGNALFDAALARSRGLKAVEIASRSRSGKAKEKT